jgi:hypothetical protein
MYFLLYRAARRLTVTTWKRQRLLFATSCLATAIRECHRRNLSLRGPTVGLGVVSPPRLGAEQELWDELQHDGSISQQTRDELGALLAAWQKLPLLRYRLLVIVDEQLQALEPAQRKRKRVDDAGAPLC